MLIAVYILDWYTYSLKSLNQSQAFYQLITNRQTQNITSRGRVLTTILQKAKKKQNNKTKKKKKNNNKKQQKNTQKTTTKKTNKKQQTNKTQMNTKKKKNSFHFSNEVIALSVRTY